MLAYNPKERITLKEISEHEWVQELSAYTSADDIKKEFIVEVKPKKTKRGITLNTGEKGGTNPYKDCTEDFIVQKETLPAYSIDRREMYLVPTVTVCDIIEAL